MAETARNVETQRQRIDARLGALQNERKAMEPLWRECRDNFLPQRGRFDGESAETVNKKSRLPNNTPLRAMRTLASGLHAGLTSPARPWQRTAVRDEDLAEWGPVKEWLAVVDQRMMSWYSKSNLYQALPYIYAEYGGFGTMCMLSYEDDDALIRFDPFTVGQYYLGSDYRGGYDTLYREFSMSVRKVVARWGEARVGVEVRRKWADARQRDQKLTILHVIEPEGDRWVSLYYDKARRTEADGGLIQKAMFDECPIHAATWERVLGESYASSCPGFMALGDSKALQVDERDKARAIQRHHNPPMQAPGTANGYSLAPGAMNYVDAMQATGQNGMIRPVHEFTPNIQGLLDNIQRGEQGINAACFVDLFLMLTLDERNQRATAEEIRAKYDEKVLALGPTLEQANAMLRGIHSRTFGIMVRRSKPMWEGIIDGTPLLPPPPRELQDQEIVPEFVSALAQAQRAQTLQGIERYAAFAGQVSSYLGKPSEKFDADQAMDEYAAGLGVPPRMVRDDDEVAEMRRASEEREQMQQMAAMAPALKQGAEAMKVGAETVPAEGNILSALSGALQ